jgi:hypothetical protein
MSTEEPINDVPLEPATPSKDQSDSNEVTSPVAPSVTSPGGAIDDSQGSAKVDEASESAPKSPAKIKATVTSDAKKGVKPGASTLRTAAGAAPKKVRAASSRVILLGILFIILNVVAYMLTLVVISR